MADASLVTADPDLSPDSAPTKPSISRGARACTVCRTAKMKCVGAEDDGAKPCQRCRRSNLECIFEKHRRGRKPGSKLSEASKMLRKIEKGLNSAKVKAQDTTELSSRLPYPISDSRSAPPDQLPVHSPYSPRELYVPSQAPRSPNTSPYLSSATQSHFPSLTSPYTTRHSEPTSRPSVASETPPHSDDEYKDPDDAMYPAKMVEREGRRHSFFGTILHNPHPHTVGGKLPPQKTHSPRPPSISIPRLPSARLEDPVTSGLISEADVSCIFDMIFLRLNPFVNLFDPALHTPAYVRSRCPFLFTVLLMAGCTFWKPELAKPCQRVAEDFCLRAFQEGWKRVEVVQAFACMTYWKDPDDTRSWQFIGYACRMAVELGLNAYCPLPPMGETNQQRLERRNRERTYLVLWVHDRSLSMQTGRQWMLPEDDLVRNSAKWHDGSTLLPIDIVISAQVQLRRIGAEVTDVFYLHKGAAGAVHPDVNYEILLRGCNSKLNAWSETWTLSLKKGGGEQFHFSLLSFFRLHVRLFLNSFGLQSSLLHPSTPNSPSISALAVCYTSAVDTLKLVTTDFANIDMLRYGQDSITVMTAYSAIFLLKLVRTGAELGEGTTAKVHDLILAVADAYKTASKALQPSSSVEHHGIFLRTLVARDRARQARKNNQRGSVHSGESTGAPEMMSPTAGQVGAATGGANGHASAEGVGAGAGASQGAGGLHQPQPQHPGSASEQAYATPWRFPASPHLPPHPLIISADSSQQYDDQVRNAQMEMAYWYSVHTSLGYGSGDAMNYLHAVPQQQQQQHQQQYPPMYAGHANGLPAG